MDGILNKMSDQTNSRRGLVVKGLVSVAILLLVVIYFVPIWWVSLTAPQYPKEAFPDGVRIMFGMNGVFNGCKLQGKAEIQEDEAVDCVHEMDAINHFVGMYPIASGGVLEKAFSPFLLSMLGVMLIGFMIFNPRRRILVMSIGFFAIAVWMAMTFFMNGGLRYQSADYLSALVTALGQGHEEAGEDISPIIARLRESLQTSGESSLSSRAEVMASVKRSGQKGLKEALDKLHKGSKAEKGKSLKEILAEAKESKLSGKQQSILILKQIYESGQMRKPKNERRPWAENNWQTLFWHYSENLGRWFNNPAEIKPLVKIMTTAGYLLFGGILAGMVLMVFAGRNNSSAFYWLLVLVPVLLPVFFLVEYASWLWWYGHSMNAMGAFSLKPFMPTVFGQGKVAQFATHSYPSYGFGLMLLFSVLLALAGLIRRKQMKEEAGA